MPRYIDTDKISYHFLRVVGHSEPEMFATEFEINAIPTADVAEVKHGEWIKDAEDFTDGNSTHKCSCCGGFIDYYNGGADEYNYCPNCGAKMDGVINED